MPLGIALKSFIISILCPPDVNAERTSGPTFSLAFGNGFVDIAALTTLVGSSAAESLLLGDRGFGGLPWAAISAFGALFVIKACVTGASASWLRVTLGVRNVVSDGALGMALRLERGRSNDEKARRNLGEALGIICKNVTRKAVTSAETFKESMTVCRDVYAFDRSTLNLVNTVPASKPGDPLVVYTFADYEFLWEGSDSGINGQDWLAILSSLPKLSELYVLWRVGASNLCWVTGIGWFYFFIAAFILSLREHWGYRPSDFGLKERGVDVVVGYLPSAKRVGGERKIILGASDNGRLSLLQRSIWAVGSVVCIAWLMATYILLGQYEPKITFIWAGFQILWLLFRLLFHHFADVKYPISHRILPTPTAWVDMDYSMKARALELTMGIAQYQTYIHPRGGHSYREDVYTTTSLRSVFSQVQFILHPKFPIDQFSITETILDVTVIAVVGDHTLTSAAWMHGSAFNGMDLYDSCIVFLQTKASVFAVPSARVLSQTYPASPSKRDIEHPTVRRFVPRSSPNAGHHIIWWYWIPCRDGLWLQLQSEDTKILGERKAEIMTDAQITGKLQVGNLNISLSKVEDVKQITGLSMQAGRLLLQFFK